THLRVGCRASPGPRSVDQASHNSDGSSHRPLARPPCGNTIAAGGTKHKSPRSPASLGHIMGLTKKEVTSVLSAWPKKKNIKPKCRWCGSAKWHTGTICDLPDHFTPHSAIGAITLICSTCGRMEFLSAASVMAESMPQDPKPDQA